MFTVVLPVVFFILIIVILIGTKYLLEGTKTETESFVNPDTDAKLKRIEMNLTRDTKDKERVERMFRAYWKIQKDNGKDLIQNPFGERDIPAWIQTEKDVTLYVPYILPYMLGQTDKLPQTKEEVLEERFTNMSKPEKEISLEDMDDMSNDEIEDALRNQQLKEMTPKEAEKMAYETLQNLSNNKFDDKFYDAISYVTMSFAQKAMPDATPEQLKGLGVQLKQQLPPVISQLQMQARSVMRKVEGARQRETVQRRKQVISHSKEVKKANNTGGGGGVIRLDREAYLKQLPEHKRILMESFTGNHKEHFSILNRIFSAILRPVIDGITKGLMPLITGFINIGVKAFTQMLPTIVNDVFIPLVSTTVNLISSIFTNQKLMNEIIKVIQKLIDLGIEIGYGIIKALSIPILTLFFKYIMPMIVVAVRFFIFLFRMAVRLAVTVWNMIVGFVKRNWSYVVSLAEEAYVYMKEMGDYVYKLSEPYITYAMYIATPIVLIGALLLIGPQLLSLMNSMVIMGITATPERTFRPTVALVDAAAAPPTAAAVQG